MKTEYKTMVWDCGKWVDCNPDNPEAEWFKRGPQGLEQVDVSEVVANDCDCGGTQDALLLAQEQAQEVAK